jgi:hypothetical protein
MSIKQIGKAGAASVDVLLERVQGDMRQGGQQDGFSLPPR